MQKYIHKILKSSPPELLDQFYNICNHNFAHLNWFIRWVVWPMGLLFKCTTRRNLSVKYYGHFKDFRLKHINHVTVYNTDWFFWLNFVRYKFSRKKFIYRLNIRWNIFRNSQNTLTFCAIFFSISKYKNKTEFFDYLN